MQNISVKEKKTDVLIELEGRNVIVELNTEGKSIRLRNFNFFTSFYSTRIKRGKKYLDDTEHILINLSYNMGKKYPIKDEFYVQNKNREKYVKNFKIIEFNMDKITYECYDKIVRGMEEQYKYLCMLNLEEEKLKSISDDGIVKEYMDKLVELNNNDEFRYVVSEEEDAKLIQELLQDSAREEGRNEGAKEKEIEIARNMINTGADINYIKTVTGLSIKEIKNIKN